MDYSAFIAGLLLIIIGFLVVKFPMLIAGYNTMPKEKRDKVDIAGLSRMMRRWFIGIGICQIIGVALLNKQSLYGIKEAFSAIFLLVGIMIVFVKAQKYNP